MGASVSSLSHTARQSRYHQHGRLAPFERDLPTRKCPPHSDADALPQFSASRRDACKSGFATGRKSKVSSHSIRPSYSVNCGRNVTMKSLVCADANIASNGWCTRPDSVWLATLWAEWEAQQAIVIAPTLWAYEVTSVLRKLVHQGRLSPELEQRTLTTAYHLPVSLRRPTDCTNMRPILHAASTVQPPMTRTIWRWPRWSAARSGRVTNGCSTLFTLSCPGCTGWALSKT